MDRKKIQPKRTIAPTGKKSTPIAPVERFWAKQWIPALILFALPFLLYFASTSYGYLLDDKMVFSENKFVQKGSKGISEIFGKESFTGFLGEQQDLVEGARYRPLSIATFALEHQYFGTKPGLSHGINILLYSLTALLIFRLLSLILPPKPERKWYFGVPFIAALLFCLHPVHTEVVANIKGRDEILALLFSLAAAYYALRYAQQEKLHQLILAPAMFLLALFAKENALTFLAVIPLALYLFMGVPVRKLLIIMAPIGLVALAYIGIRQSVIGYLLDNNKEITSLMNNPFVEAKGSQKSATIALTLGWYIKLLFYPHPLTHDYYPYHVPLVNWADWRAISALLLHVGLIGAAIWQFRKAKVFAFCVFYYIATLSMASNIFFSVGTFMNERFIYMPSVGFCLLLAWLAIEKLPELFKSRESSVRYAGMALLGIFMVGFAARTYTRVPDWEDEHSLEKAAIKVSVNSCRSNQFYAYSLYVQSISEKDPVKQKALYDEAFPYVSKSLEIYPTYNEALTCKSGIMAGYYQQDGKIQPLLDWFEHVLKTHPVVFVDQYLEFLSKRGRHVLEMGTFFQKVGYDYFWKAKGDAASAKKQMGYWGRMDPANPVLQESLAAINSGKR